ncbi:hypothetical protein GQ42DRAFT_160791 [Ramicandelaber brevisporus]|nr:hypothetical protein GQ42DRAFT_160791 [Ramicandelaber brevisporus]
MRSVAGCSKGVLALLLFAALFLFSSAVAQQQSGNGTQLDQNGCLICSDPTAGSVKCLDGSPPSLVPRTCLSCSYYRCDSESKPSGGNTVVVPAAVGGAGGAVILIIAIWYIHRSMRNKKKKQQQELEKQQQQLNQQIAVDATVGAYYDPTTGTSIIGNTVVGPDGVIVGTMVDPSIAAHSYLHGYHQQQSTAADGSHLAGFLTESKAPYVVRLGSFSLNEGSPAAMAATAAAEKSVYERGYSHGHVLGGNNALASGHSSGTLSHNQYPPSQQPTSPLSPYDPAMYPHTQHPFGSNSPSFATPAHLQRYPSGASGVSGLGLPHPAAIATRFSTQPSMHEGSSMRHPSGVPATQLPTQESLMSLGEFSLASHHGVNSSTNLDPHAQVEAQRSWASSVRFSNLSGIQAQLRQQLQQKQEGGGGGGGGGGGDGSGRRKSRKNNGWDDEEDYSDDENYNNADPFNSRSSGRLSRKVPARSMPSIISRPQSSKRKSTNDPKTPTLSSFPLPPVDSIPPLSTTTVPSITAAVVSSVTASTSIAQPRPSGISRSSADSDVSQVIEFGNPSSGNSPVVGGRHVQKFTPARVALSHYEPTTAASTTMAAVTAAHDVDMSLIWQGGALPKP